MPIRDFSTHDSQFTPEQEAQSARLIDGVRAINARVVRLGGTLEDLTAAADRVEELLASLDAVTRSRDIQSFGFGFDRDDPNNVIPFNPATGRYNPIAPRLEMRVDGDRIVTVCEFANCHESGPDTVQGGMVAAVHDQVLAYAVMLEGFTGPTLWVRVAFVKPTPINEPLRFESWVDSVDGRKYTARACCYHGEEKTSEAEALILGAYEFAKMGPGEG